MVSKRRVTRGGGQYINMMTGLSHIKEDILAEMKVSGLVNESRLVQVLGDALLVTGQESLLVVHLFNVEDEGDRGAGIHTEVKALSNTVIDPESVAARANKCVDSMDISNSVDTILAVTSAQAAVRLKVLIATGGKNHLDTTTCQEVVTQSSAKGENGAGAREGQQSEIVSNDPVLNRQ